MVLAYVAVAQSATAVGTITDVRKIAGNARLVMSTVDIGEGAPLPEGTIYGVYEES
jgi:hypothetical protein